MKKTLPELDNLTVEELRLEVAKAQGWKWREWEGGNCKFLRRDKNFVYGAQMVDDGKILFYNDILPNWPVNIADAWELVAKAEITIIPAYSGGKIVRYYACQQLSTSYHQNPSDNWFEADMNYFVHGESAPIAICKAYLAWKYKIPTTLSR